MLSAYRLMWMIVMFDLPVVEKAEGKAELLTRLLQRRFGPLPDWVETRLSQATPAQLDTWADRVFDATLLESVFD